MRIRALLYAGFSCWLATLACNSKGASGGNPGERVESLAALSTELGLQFPPSTHLVGVRRASGMDDIVRVKLELQLDELPSLVEQTRIHPDDFHPGTRGMLGPDRDFWDPHQRPAIRTGQTKRPGARALNLGIDDSGPDRAIVYLVEHGT